jgi:hypothetical protein
VARYPDIGDHGLIGDLQTAALMSTCCSKSSLPCANDRAAAAQRRDRLPG